MTLPNKKRRDKTGAEFTGSLMIYLGKKPGKEAIDFDLFSKSLENCVNL